MLQTVMRPAMSSPRMADPAYSITCPVPPAVPILPMMASTMSFAVTPAPNSPSTETSMFFAGFCSSVCVAITCSTSLVPMPKASAPIAPCVDVWLSPQTIVVAGRLMPSSGPMMCTIPCRASSSGI